MQLKKRAQFIPRYQSSVSIHDLLSVWKNQSNPPKTAFSKFGFNTTFYRSAADALYAYLESNELKGNIIIPAYTCDRVVSAIISAKATPLFIDVDDQTGTPPEKTFIEACERYQAVAIIATHMFGNPPQVENLIPFCRTKGIHVIEDAALSTPAFITDMSSSNYPDATIVSFGKGKLFSLGIGGLLMEHLKAESTESCIPYINQKPNSDNETDLKGLLSMYTYISPFWIFQVHIISWLKRLTNRKRKTKPFYPETILGNKLSPLAERIIKCLITPEAYLKNLSHSQFINHIYSRKLKPTKLIHIPSITQPDNFIAPHYPISTPKKQELHRHLAQQGFDTGTYFNYCIGQLVTQNPFPNSECFAQQALLLPNHKGMTESKANELAQIINRWADGHTQLASR